MSQKLLYVRGAPYELKFDSYNLQEIGLCSAFCKRGYNCTILYYSHKNKNQVIKVGEYTITILWRKGIRLLRSGIYPDVLKRDFLKGFDIIVTSEYGQIMSVLLCKMADNVYVYNGPYYNLFKIPPFEKIYDILFAKYLNCHSQKIFCKTEMAKKYLKSKGITNSIAVGVGLDVSKFDKEIVLKNETRKLLKSMKGHRNLLYVGSIIKRKNVQFIMQIFNHIKQDGAYSDVQLVLVGKGDKNYADSCFNELSEHARNSVVHVPSIENAQLKYIYPQAYAFLLPSKQEIFGMVLLEAMFFGLPVISSDNAGAETLIKDKENGYIIQDYDEQKWVVVLRNLLDSPNQAQVIGYNAGKTIKKQFMWDSISQKMMCYFSAKKAKG